MCSLESNEFGHLPNGDVVTCHVMKNSIGCEVHILNYGGIIQKLMVSDTFGNRRDVVLGFDSIEHYLNPLINPYFGAIIGRCCNRIQGGQFEIDGIEYHCSVNETDKNNTLHGGHEGFDKKLWKVTDFTDECPEVLQLTLTYTSPDGEEGFPGTLTCTVDYILRKNQNNLKIRYRAVTDKKTICNLTNHSYFNLEGHDSGKHLHHSFQIYANSYIPINSNCIPLGQIRSVVGTPFDFLEPKALRQNITNFNDEQIKIGCGFDHSFYSKQKKTDDLILFSSHKAPNSGIAMEIMTTQPGCQLYTGNWIPNAERKGKDGASYGVHSGFAMETQNLPDAIHHSNFPNCILSPGEVYDHSTIFKFFKVASTPKI